MLRELAKPNRAEPDRKVGTITAVHGTGTYGVSIWGATYDNVPSASFRVFAVGDTVVVIFQDAKPLIVH